MSSWYLVNCFSLLPWKPDKSNVSTVTLLSDNIGYGKIWLISILHLNLEQVWISHIKNTWSICPLTDEWIKKLWYIYTIEYYSAIKRNKFESVLMRWMNPEPFIQSEVSQSTSWEMLGWRKHKLESRFPGKISITSDM